MSEQIKEYKQAWQNARELAEKELEEIFNGLDGNLIDFDLKKIENLNQIKVTQTQVIEDQEDENHLQTSEDEDNIENKGQQQSNKGTSTIKDDYIVNQEVQRELLREIEYKGEILKVYKITYQNGDIYEGELIDDLKDGSGTYYYENGEKYDGNFQEDLIHGYGKYFFLGGHRYEGDWIQGRKEGLGILDFQSGDRYIGWFKNDYFEGEGTFYYSNGDIFKGNWKKGKKNGDGKMSYKNKRVIIGEWIDDELQPF